MSIAFKFLCKGDFEKNEAKDYAAKNIMLNIHSIFRQTLNSLEQHPQLQGKLNIKEIRQDLIIQIDNILNNIFINLVDLYPEAIPSGGTLRMREAINQVDRVDDP